MKKGLNQFFIGIIIALTSIVTSAQSPLHSNFAEDSLKKRANIDHVFNCEVTEGLRTPLYMPKKHLIVKMSEAPDNPHSAGWDGLGLLIGPDRERYILVSWLDDKYVRQSIKEGHWLWPVKVHFKMSHVSGNNPSVTLSTFIHDKLWSLKVGGVEITCSKT